ncbi:hypothetical protein PoB_003797400 [Plakobranchus ocellatus]|uniref:Sushi domain-containing protein n=1 Tax=Plakobranchus ocellatus TaxID=259542 RepID=A0AAV4AYM2_9GAST|nr:hypothetical protein PoB_003797400 [Plakobranchus ocellatus]
MNIDGPGAPWRSFKCSRSLGYICEIAPPSHCYEESRTYRQGAQVKLPFHCGNPYICRYGLLIPTIAQCRWNGSCLNLNETRDGFTCTEDWVDG